MVGGQGDGERALGQVTYRGGHFLAPHAKGLHFPHEALKLPGHVRPQHGPPLGLPVHNLRRAATHNAANASYA
jgi:hypothetical protein